ncbi:MAG TPA: isocitrate lyase/phosphoenolpyruvate mutase family protein [Caulobacteraceae bacterium]|nr:isocitrate lyase/phosphoenolpyruvate mutase family protein [Caulobacteraceae bacterium]
MSRTTAEKRREFGRLHEGGCFVLPNPWDVGSAVLLAHLGFKALASTSAGMAWSLGRLDGGAALDEVLVHLDSLARATDLPLNADFENGFADDRAGVAANVALALDTGIAGLSVEDCAGPAAGLYDFTLAVERVTAAREAIDAAAPGAVLTARSEGFIRGRPDLDETIRRLQAFAAAGADCLYAPGLRQEEQIRAVVAAVAPKPVNVLSPGLPVASLAALGVRRISVGGALAAAAYGEALHAAREMADQGTFSTLARAASGRELSPVFAQSRSGAG